MKKVKRFFLNNEKPKEWAMFILIATAIALVTSSEIEYVAFWKAVVCAAICAGAALMLACIEE